MTTTEQDPTDNQTLIERFDIKTSMHIIAFVAIVFGAFSILILLTGKAGEILNLSVLYLTFIELIFFPLVGIYCLFRSIYYSMCAEKIKDHLNLVFMEKWAKEEALDAIPVIAKKVNIIREKLVKFDKKNLGLDGDYRRLFLITLLLYILWFVTVLAVLWLPK